MKVSKNADLFVTAMAKRIAKGARPTYIVNKLSKVKDKVMIKKIFNQSEIERDKLIKRS